MKLILTDNDGVVIDSWNTDDCEGIDYDIFERIASYSFLAQFTREQIESALKELDERLGDNEKN